MPRSITADLRALHSRAYHPEQIVVAAAGNVEHDALLETLETAGWADIPRGGLPTLRSPAPIVQAPGAVHFERDTAQTHIVFGSTVFAHSDPRRYAMSMIGMLFGGGMSSRLFQRIREELGLAYSVYSFQSFHEDSGVHGVYVGTTPESARAAVDAINSENGDAGGARAQRRRPDRWKKPVEGADYTVSGEFVIANVPGSRGRAL